MCVHACVCVCVCVDKAYTTEVQYTATTPWNCLLSFVWHSKCFSPYGQWLEVCVEFPDDWLTLCGRGTALKGGWKETGKKSWILWSDTRTDCQSHSILYMLYISWLMAGEAYRPAFNSCPVSGHYSTIVVLFTLSVWFGQLKLDEDTFCNSIANVGYFSSIFIRV
jgi:hypothetical protein